MSNVQPITDAYDVAAARLARGKTTTLAECVPLLSVALEVVRHGPDGISIEDVERYRIKAGELLSHVQPVVERRADLTLEDWAAGMLLEPGIAGSLS